MIKGIVFDIKRFSIQDGPGIRTTVFLKGCPLSCFWCHNPESQAFSSEIMYRETRCTHCHSCVQLCPQKAIQIGTEKIPITDSLLCTKCGICTEGCMADAREIIGQEMTVDQVITEIQKDIAFYDQSHGGVTFSGGEPLSQPDFLLSLLKACKEREIHTVLDTSGLQNWDILDKIRVYVDLFLYDLKIIDRDKHILYTGVDNILIINNLISLSHANQAMIIRIPVIPGINDDEDNINATALLLSSIRSVTQVDLLSYHRLGFGKYKGLGKEIPNTYAFDIQQTVIVEKMDRFAMKLNSVGLKVNIM